MRSDRRWAGFRQRQSPQDSSGVSLETIEPWVVPTILVGHEESDDSALEIAGGDVAGVAFGRSWVQLWPGEHDLWVERVWALTGASLLADQRVYLLLVAPPVGSVAPPPPLQPMRGGTTVGITTGTDGASAQWSVPQGWIELGNLLVPRWPPRQNTNAYQPPARALRVVCPLLSEDLAVTFCFREGR